MRYKYNDICSSRVITFSTKCIGILDDLNYKRFQKIGESSTHATLSLVLIFVLVLPAWFLISLAVAIAVIAENLTGKTKEVL